jgi:hypothetical protein
MSSSSAGSPAFVHARRTECGVAAGVPEADLQIRKLVHDAAVDQAAEGDGALHEVADHVGQAVPRRAVLDHRRGALVEEHRRPGLLDRAPERVELRLVRRVAVDVIADRHPAESQGAHCVLHGLDRQADVLERDGGQRREAIREHGDHLCELVVALPCDPLRDLGLEVVLEEPRVDRERVDVHTHLVHLGDTVLRADGELRDVQLAHVRPQPVPLTITRDCLDEPAGGDVVVDIDHRHADLLGTPSSRLLD